AFYRMLGDHFYSTSGEFEWREIPCEDELKTSTELAVALPEDNADFQTLAASLAESLPRRPKISAEAEQAPEHRAARRAILKRIVKAPDYQVKAALAHEKTEGTTKSRGWRLRVGDDWTVPAVELTRGDSTKTVLLVHDSGRAAAVSEINRLLDEGARVVAVDPFYFGESKIASRDFLFGLLVASVGERPLGIQAAQLAAVARWLDGDRELGPVHLVAVGPRSGLFAMIAAAIETKTVAGIEATGSFGGLKEIIEQNQAVNQAPELFCFGLLREFDVRDVAALVAPRPVTFRGPSDRVRKEFGDPGAWKKLRGGDLKFID
ncbi:MAG: hypothetical protein N2C14_15300, partial [Planctomycetales bacterium]